jgi:glycosyltransferase involved in cell wall biosynthesis
MPPDERTLDSLVNIKKKHYYPKIDVIFLDQNVGPGVSRSLGVLKAFQRGHNVVFFIDSDDISQTKENGVIKQKPSIVI